MVPASTLAALTPVHPLEVRYRRLKSSQRLVGSWLMALRRPSRTPESSRPYVKGDPVNLIDWKAYARTDQLIVREQRDEASARVVIGLEATTSMAWPTQEVGASLVKRGVAVPPSKIEIATRLALNLAWIHLRQGDLVEIWFATGEGTWFSRRAKLRSPSDAVTFFNRVLPVGGQPGMIDALVDASSPDQCARERADLTYLIGDGLEAFNYQQFYAIGRNFAFCHLLSSLEADVSWAQNQTSYFDDSRVLKEHQGESLRWKDNYRRGLERWMRRLQTEVEMVGGHYLLMNESTPIDYFHDFIASLELAGAGSGGSGLASFRSRFETAAGASATDKHSFVTSGGGNP